MFGGGGILERGVGGMRALLVERLGIGGDNVRCNVRGDLEEVVVGVDWMGIMVGWIMEVVFMLVGGLFELGDRVDDGIVEVIVELGNMCIKIRDIVFGFRS